MESAMNGMADHGYNYNLSDVDFGSLIQSGSATALQAFTELPLSTEGLFTFPVRVTTSLQDMPDNVQIEQDYYHTGGGSTQNNPCSCANFTFTVPETGQVQAFTDYVTANVRDYAACLKLES